jgi:hypothetical protein
MLDVTPAQLPSSKLLQSKQLINSFILANFCDALVTGVALTLPGFVEKGLLGQHLLAQSQTIPLLIFKTAITAFMIGIYALTMNRQARWARPVALALQICTVLVWCAVAWNELNIVVAMAALL